MTSPTSAITNFNPQAPVFDVALLQQLKFYQRDNDAQEVVNMAKNQLVLTDRHAYLASHFAWNFEICLSKDYTQFNSHQLTELFGILFALLPTLQRYNADSAEFRSVAFNFFNCFTYASRYGLNSYKIKEQTLQLPLQLHLEAWRVCKEVLQRGEMHQDAKRHLLDALPYIVNHPDMSADVQLEIFSYIIQGGISTHDDISHIHHMIAFEHATPPLQNAAAKQLFSILQESNVKHLKKQIIDWLPFLPHYRYVKNEIRSASVQMLCSIVQNTNVEESLKKKAAESLGNWLWSFGKDIHMASQDIQRALSVLKNQLFLGSGKLQETIALRLFCGIWTQPHDSPLVQHLLPFYKELFLTDAIPVSLKLALAERMPRGTEHVMPKEITFVDLMGFMLQRIDDPYYPLELKKEFVMHVVQCYLWDTSRKLIRQHMPSLGTLEAVMALPSIQRVHQLLEMAKQTRANNLKVEAEINRRFTPIGNGLTVFHLGRISLL